MNKFDPQKVIDRYRTAIAQRDAATTPDLRAIYDGIAIKLRQQWQAWQGEDSLHEIAFGEPIE